MQQNDASAIVLPFPTDSIPELSPSREVAGQEPATAASEGGFELRFRLRVSPSFSILMALG